jgi:hypothetical protein
MNAIAFPLAGERVSIVEGDTGIEVRDGTGAPIGSVILEYEGNSVFIRALCIEEERRGYGAGSEGAQLLIAAATAAGVETVSAWAPPNLGLAVYFWIRMGLRPKHGEGPDGGIRFERALRAGATASR